MQSTKVSSIRSPWFSRSRPAETQAEEDELLLALVTAQDGFTRSLRQDYAALAARGTSSSDEAQLRARYKTLKKAEKQPTKKQAEMEAAARKAKLARSHTRALAREVTISLVQIAIGAPPGCTLFWWYQFCCALAFKSV